MKLKLFFRAMQFERLLHSWYHFIIAAKAVVKGHEVLLLNPKGI